MREAVAELIVGLVISFGICAVAIGVIETVVDRYVDGSRATSSSALPSRPGAR